MEGLIISSYYETHKEEVCKKHKEYYKENKEAILSKQKRIKGSIKGILKEHDELLKDDKERLKLFCIKGRVILATEVNINTNKKDNDR